jgi:hypothetical protein
MNKQDVINAVRAELARPRNITTRHGITLEQIDDFVVDPFLVEVLTPGDPTNKSKEVWLVLDDVGHAAVLDPIESTWGVAQKMEGNIWVLVSWDLKSLYEAYWSI